MYQGNHRCVVRELAGTQHFVPVQYVQVLQHGEKLFDGVFDLATVSSNHAGPSCPVEMVIGDRQGEVNEVGVVDNPNSRPNPSYDRTAPKPPCCDGYPRG